MAGVVLQFGVTGCACHHLPARIDSKRTPSRSATASLALPICLRWNPIRSRRRPADSRGSRSGIHPRVSSMRPTSTDSPSVPSSSSPFPFGAFWIVSAEGSPREPSPSRTVAREKLNGFAAEKEFAFDRLDSDFPRNAGAWGGTWGVAILGSAGAAIATEMAEAPPPVQGAQPTDYLLIFLSTAAFLGLALLTIGVIYLSVSDFLENRERNQMKKEAGEDEEQRSKRDTARVGSPKGFGPPRVEKKTEKSK